MSGFLKSIIVTSLQITSPVKISNVAAGIDCIDYCIIIFHIMYLRSINNLNEIQFANGKITDDNWINMILPNFSRAGVHMVDYCYYSIC